MRVAMKNRVRLNSKVKLSHFKQCLTLTVALACGCTTSAPVEKDQNQKTTNNDAHPQQQANELKADQEALKSSVFVALSKDSKELELWEKSEGWIKFYQGQSQEAIRAFEQELTGQDTAPQLIKVGRVRAMLELAVSYQHLVEINQFLINKWLTYERGRPNSSNHAQWYNLIEALYLSSEELSDSKENIRLTELKKLLEQSESSNVWFKALSNQESVPAKPQLSSDYRRWQSFIKAFKANQIDSAYKKLLKLNPNGELFTLSGEGEEPSLTIYDPRIPAMLTQFYAQLTLQNCTQLEFGSYYSGRAYELLKQSSKAIQAYQEALTAIETLSLNSKQNFIQHVLLTSHTSFNGFRDELKARILLLEQKQHTESSPQPKSAQSSLDQDNSSTSALLWQALNLSKDEDLPQLFPQRRRALGQIFATALEEAKGTQLNYVASLGLNDRWLDAMHYQYARLLIERDERVSALKTLNASEEAKAGSRLQGRNRLPRLLLSAYNQINMDRYRVGAKYFQRLKTQVPALSFILAMTGDILSGKSFENNGSRANVGQ